MTEAIRQCRFQVILANTCHVVKVVDIVCDMESHSDSKVHEYEEVMGELEMIASFVLLILSVAMQCLPGALQKFLFSLVRDGYVSLEA